jgi:hypothetical protein
LLCPVATLAVAGRLSARVTTDSRWSGALAPVVGGAP